MGQNVVIENIEQMRLRLGIDDTELRCAVRRLRVGDAVRLTFLSGSMPAVSETVQVRITELRAGTFRGELASKPASARFADLSRGSAVAFTRGHIHSVVTANA